MSALLRIALVRISLGALLSTAAIVVAQDVMPLPIGWVGSTYQAKIGSDGATPPLTWIIRSGALPPGLSLTDGVISGVPSTTQADPYKFEIQVSDSSQPPRISRHTFSIRILQNIQTASPVPIQCLRDLDTCLRNAAQTLTSGEQTQCEQDEKIAKAQLDDCKTAHPADVNACRPQEARLNSICEILPREPPQNPRPVDVLWLAHPPYSLEGNRLVWDDTDPDQHMPLWVCAVELVDQSTHQLLGAFPGKLLNNNCNVAYKGRGAEIQTNYFFAMLTRGDGYWGAPNGHTADMLTVTGIKGIPEPAPGPPPTVTDNNRTEMTVCRADFTRKEGLDAFVATLFPSDVEHGKHVGYLLEDGCHFEWGGGEQVSNRYVEVYYKLLRPPQTPPANQPAPQPRQPAQPLPTTTCRIPAHIAACGPAGVLQHQDIGCSITCHDPNHPAYCVPDSCTGYSYIQELCVCKQ
jgi:Putative Ig domain